MKSGGLLRYKVGGGRPSFREISPVAKRAEVGPKKRRGGGWCKGGGGATTTGPKYTFS